MSMQVMDEGGRFRPGTVMKIGQEGNQCTTKQCEKSRGHHPNVLSDSGGIAVMFLLQKKSIIC